MLIRCGLILVSFSYALPKNKGCPIAVKECMVMLYRIMEESNEAWIMSTSKDNEW